VHISTVFWIRIGFNTDPDPAFYLDADQGPGSQTNADPCELLIRIQVRPYFPKIFHTANYYRLHVFAVTKSWFFT
jgi:hypothetical protein